MGFCLWRLHRRWDGHLFEAGEELLRGRGGGGEGFLAAVNGDQLLIEGTNDAAAQEAAVVGFIGEDVSVAGRGIDPMTVAGVMEPTAGVNPKDKFGKTVRELTECLAATAKDFSKKREPASGLILGDGTEGDHAEGELQTLNRQTTSEPVAIYGPEE